MCNKDKILAKLNEEERVSKWLYLFKRASIYDLENYPRKYQLKEDEKNGLITFNPSAFQRIGFIITGLLFVPLLFKIFSDNSNNLVFIIPVISLGLYATYRWLKRAFSSNLNYPVSIAKEGISIKNNFYEWKQIDNIFFIERVISRESKTFIIIVSKTCFIERYEITNLSCGKIVSAIIYYRTVNSGNENL